MAERERQAGDQERAEVDLVYMGRGESAPCEDDEAIEAEEAEKLRERLAQKLNEIANALHGGPLEDGLWSFHDLPELAEELVAHLRAYRDSSMVHAHCAAYDPIMGNYDTRCGTCKAVDFILNREGATSEGREDEGYHRGQQNNI